MFIDNNVGQTIWMHSLQPSGSASDSLSALQRIKIISFVRPRKSIFICKSPLCEMRYLNIHCKTYTLSADLICQEYIKTLKIFGEIL